MSAVIDCLQCKPGETARWVLVRNALGHFSWSRRADMATRFEDAEAEDIKRDRGQLPNLPTDPPVMPVMLRVVHGHYAEPVFPRAETVIERPTSPPLPELVRLRKAKARPPVSPSEAFEEQEKRHLA